LYNLLSGKTILLLVPTDIGGDITYPNLFVHRRFVPWAFLTLFPVLTLTLNSNTNT